MLKHNSSFNSELSVLLYTSLPHYTSLATHLLLPWRPPGAGDQEVGVLASSSNSISSVSLWSLLRFTMKGLDQIRNWNFQDPQGLQWKLGLSDHSAPASQAMQEKWPSIARSCHFLRSWKNKDFYIQCMLQKYCVGLSCQESGTFIHCWQICKIIQPLW